MLTLGVPTIFKDANFTPPARTSCPWWGDIATLWLLAAPLGTAIYALLQPIAPSDFWGHLRAGWFLAHTGHIPTTNLFASGAPLDRPFLYQSWLAEWLMYQISRTGLASLIWCNAICLSGAVALVVAAAYRRGLRCGAAPAICARAAAGGGMLAMLVFSNNVDIRPQTFSTLLFGLWLFLLAEWPFASGTPRRLLALAFPALMAIWVNIHGAFAAALVTLAMCAIGEAVARKRYLLLLSLALCVGATCLNPKGWHLFGYLAMMARLPITRRFIVEWQKPTWNEWHNALFFVAPLLPLGLAGLRWRRMSAGEPTPAALPVFAGEWLAGTALFLMGLGAVRAIIWFGLWAGFATAASLAEVLAPPKFQPGDSDLSTAEAEAPPPRAVQLANACLAILLLLPVLAVSPGVKTQLPWPPAFAARFAPTPQRGPNGFPGQVSLIVDAATPVEAAEYLAVSPPHGKLFTDMTYGSYTIWALYPGAKPSCDPRLELYSTQFWLDYLDVSDGRANALQKLEMQGYTDLLIDTELQRGLTKILSHSPRWKLLSKHRKCRLYRLESAKRILVGNNHAR